jgi:Flp pilus assembly protein TadD
MKKDKPYPSHILLFLTITAGLATLAAVMATIGDIGITTDEPNYYNSCLQQIAWFQQAFQHFSTGNWSAPFNPEFLDRYWNFELLFNVHPPFYKLCSSLTLTLFESWLGTMEAYRLAPAIMFSILVSLLFWTAGRRYGLVAGFWVAGSFALMPRVFGHAHIGATDMPMTLLWFASAVSFHRALESKKWAVVFAVVYGLALSTKFTAFIIPLPLVAYVLVYRRFKESTWPVVAAIVTGPLIMIGLNPQWWHNTFERVCLYLGNSLTRSEYLHIPTFYLGKIYGFNLPWHHSLVYTLFTVSPLVLAGFIYGFWRIVRERCRDTWATHMLIHWLALHAVMMLPGSPGHDGVRLFLPSFAFLAAVSAKGFYHFCAEILPRMAARLPRSRLRLETFGAWLLLCVMIVPSAIVLARVHPYELSYYNSLAGGIPGAHKLGMETTYWWDPLNEEGCRLINDTLPDSARVFAMNPWYFDSLKRLGRIKKSLTFTKDNFQYVLQYSRQGFFEGQDWILYLKGKPLVELKKDGVRLLCIFQSPLVYHQVLEDMEKSSSTELSYEKTILFLFLGMTDRAVWELNKILNGSPKNFMANTKMASLYLDERLTEKAIRHLERIADNPEDPFLWNQQMGLACSQLGQNERAFYFYEQALNYKRQDPAIRRILGNAYYRLGQLEDAVEHYELVLRVEPYDERVLQRLGEINLQLDNNGKAKACYQRILQINPSNLSALVNLGMIERSDGRLDKAEEYYLRSLEIDSTDYTANLNFGNLNMEKGDALLAERHYRIILKNHPDDSKVHQALALLYLKDQARHREALEHFQILARLMPGQADNIRQNYILPLQAELVHKAGTP